MEDVFYEIKKYMLKEFQWLLTHYPLGKKMDSALHILQEEPGREEGINGFTFYNYTGNKIDTSVFIFLNLNGSFDENDQRIMKEYGIEQGEDLFFWMLYHEYGHIMDMKKIRKKSKLRTVKKRMNIYLKKTEKIREQVKRGMMSEKEGEINYRQLKEEQIADRFANEVYKKRKQNINQYKQLIREVKGETK